MADGLSSGAQTQPDALADGGYRLSKEAIILYGMRQRRRPRAPGASGSTAPRPGVTETPILDQLRSAYGQEYLDSFTTPLGRVAGPAEQAAVLVFLGSRAASYITGQVDLGGRRHRGGEHRRRSATPEDGAGELKGATWPA